MADRPDLPPMADDGLPTLPTGEPVLQRWFVIALLALAVLALAVSVWAWLSIDREELSAAERRPAGGEQVTIERGAAQLSETRDASPGPDCAQALRLVGDSGSQAAARVAVQGACDLIATGDYPRARAGLVELIAGDGQIRIATFELSGVESSTRVEDGRLVLELNAKFQFEDARRGTPAVIHQLELLTDEGWPGAAVAASTELDAAHSQQRACRDLALDDEPPRGCLDVDELLAAEDPIADLVAVGFRDDR
ncbi:MAG: hypothetical protein JJT89_02180 [Nitriliruptoraceae bacterium]|nr:hypothetical protein [Nitriliruptoraceae bacterium]